MAASCTYSVSGKVIRKHEWTWVSSSNGTVTGLGASDPISGLLRQAQFVPSATSGYTPTSGYDVTMQSGDGVDLFLGNGANIPNSGSNLLNLKFFKTDSHYEPILYGDTLTPDISNAGDAKEGVIRMFTVDPKWM